MSQSPTVADAPPRTRKAKGKGHERRGEILAAAKAMFVAEGYEAFTTRALARRVGLSQTGLYVYFASKEQLFDALCRESFVELAAAFRAALASTGEPMARLRALGRAYIDFGLAHPDEYRLTFMEGPGLIKREMPGLDDRPFDQQGVGNQIFLIIRGELERLAEAHARRIDLTIATHSVWFALHGLVSIFIARPAFLKTDHEALIEGLLDNLEKGLRPNRR